MKILLSKSKPAIQAILYLATALSVYFCFAEYANSAGGHVPTLFHEKPQTVAKLFGTMSAVLSGALTWIAQQIDIELFSGPEVAALGYVETFCNVVVEKFSLKPCYIFIPDHLTELNNPEGYAAEIEKRGLSCKFDPVTRVYTVVNPNNGKKVYLDFPSTLRNLAKVAAKDPRYKKMDKLGKNLIRSFKKHLEKRLGITYESPSIWQRIVAILTRKTQSKQRTDVNPIYFVDPTAIQNEPLAGFSRLA